MRRRFINNVNTTFDNYMFVEALYDGTDVSVNDCSPTLMYKVNDNNWEIVGDSSFNYALQIGEKIFFKDVRYATPSGVGKFTADVGFKVGGDFRSLFLGDNVKENSPLLDFCFEYMFMNSNIECFDEDILYYPILANNCYHCMFKGCHKITTTPKLPATTLASYCYSYMFSECPNLKVTCELPATTLASYCYSSMFSDCTGLTTAPALLATTLADNCYQYMFDSCTSLTTVPELPATTLAYECYNRMFRGCISLTTAPVLPARWLADYCYYYMFEGCTSLTTAPALPATSLANHCYCGMFYGCTSLTTAPTLPATALASSCYEGMFINCSSLTTAPVLPAATLVNYCYGGMFRNCSKLNYIKMLATNISAYECLKDWVYGVASTGTFVKHPNMTSLPTVLTSGIPKGWTVVNDSGENNGNENLITFYIESLDPDIGLLERKATSGMTWEEWVQSDFNLMYENIEDNGFPFQYFEIIDDNIYHYNEGWYVVYVNDDVVQPVKSTDIIEENFIYTGEA